MNNIIFYPIFSLLIILNSCSVKLSAVSDKSAEQIKTTYQVSKDLSYGSDKEQVIDLYISKDANNLRSKNFTVVFVHGGGYYMSDKSKEEQYIQPYLKKGMNVVNMNYRLKRGIPIAIEDLTIALNFLKENSATFQLNLDKVILTGFSAGAHMSSTVGLSANNPEYTYKLSKGIKISAILNFSGPVDGLDVAERVFIDSDMQLMKDVGNALFPDSEGYTPKESIVKYESITYFDKNDPPFFLWYGGKDDQILPSTFARFVDLLNTDKVKNEVIFSPDGFHSPNATELKEAYMRIFSFLDNL